MPLMGISERAVGYSSYDENINELPIWVQLWETELDERFIFLDNYLQIASSRNIISERELEYEERDIFYSSFQEILRNVICFTSSFSPHFTEGLAFSSGFQSFISERSIVFPLEHISEMTASSEATYFDDRVVRFSYTAYSELSVTLNKAHPLYVSNQRSIHLQRDLPVNTEIKAITEGYCFKYDFVINPSDNLLFSETINHTETELFSEQVVLSELLIDLDLIKLDDSYLDRGEILLIYKNEDDEYVVNNLSLNSFFIVPLFQETLNTFTVTEGYFVFTESPVYIDFEYAPYDLEGYESVSEYISFLRSQALLKVDIFDQNLLITPGYRLYNFEKFQLVPFEFKIFNGLITRSNNIFHLKWFYPTKSQKRNRISLIFSN